MKRSKSLMKRKFSEHRRSFWGLLTSEVSKPALFEWTDTQMENTGYNFKETKLKRWIRMLSNTYFGCRIRRPPGTELCLSETKDSYASIQLLPCTVWSWAGYCPNSFGLASSYLIISFPWHVGHYKEDVSCHAFWHVLGRPLLPPCLSPGSPRVAFSPVLSPAQALLPFPCQLQAHSLSPLPFQP